MAIIRWNQGRDPWTEMHRFQDEMDRLFRGFWGQTERARSTAGLFPAMNMTADERSVVIRAEMPGVQIDKVDVSINKDTVTLKGERQLPETQSEVSYHRRERRGGYFNRTIALPCEVNPEKAHATYKNGLLELVIERAAESMPRQITIKAT